MGSAGSVMGQRHGLFGWRIGFVASPANFQVEPGGRCLGLDVQLAAQDVNAQPILLERVSAPADPVDPILATPGLSDADKTAMVGGTARKLLNIPM